MREVFVTIVRLLSQARNRDGEKRESEMRVSAYVCASERRKRGEGGGGRDKETRRFDRSGRIVAFLPVPDVARFASRLSPRRDKRRERDYRAKRRAKLGEQSERKRNDKKKKKEKRETRRTSVSDMWRSRWCDVYIYITARRVYTRAGAHTADDRARICACTRRTIVPLLSTRGLG